METVGHNKIAHQHRVDADRRLPRDVHAGRLRDGRDRILSRQERRAHDEHELHGLPARHVRLLGVRLALQMGGVGGVAALGGGTAVSITSSRSRSSATAWDSSALKGFS